MDIAAFVTDNRLRVRVKPSARVSQVLRIDGAVVHIAVAAPPEDGKANAELERFLTKELRRKAVIKSGFTGREKLVQLL